MLPKELAPVSKRYFLGKCAGAAVLFGLAALTKACGGKNSSSEKTEEGLRLSPEPIPTPPKAELIPERAFGKQSVRPGARELPTPPLQKTRPSGVYSTKTPTAGEIEVETN